MFLISTLGIVSILLVLAITPIVRDRLGPLGFLDHPDGQRKKHGIAIPRVGGIAIVISYVTTFVIAFWLPFTYGQVLHAALPSIGRLSVGAAVVFLTGVLDDLVSLKAWQKLAGIGVAAALAYWAGIRVDVHLLPVVASWPWLSFPITVLWLIACANAFNLIDGMDGLAAGIGLFATITILLAALLQGNLPLVMATMPLAGCLLGFLRYNFNPASVFLGDSGSLVIGFLLGCYGALWSEKAVTLVALTVPVLSVAIPLVDVGISIARRYLRARPIFGADRGHIHHKLLDRGFSQRGSVFMIYGLCGLLAAISLIVLAARHFQFSGLLVIVFCVAVWIGIQSLGYGEFAMAGEMFFKGKFRRIIDTETRLKDFETALMSATPIENCWTLILDGSREFGFHGVRLSVGEKVFEHFNRKAGPEWQIRIPLPGAQYVNFYGDLTTMTDPLILNAFVGAIERGMKEMLNRRQSELLRLPPGTELSYGCPPQLVQHKSA